MRIKYRKMTNSLGELLYDLGLGKLLECNDEI